MSANLKAGKFFGTIPGNSTLAGAATEILAAAPTWGGMLVTSNSGKTAAGSGATKCDAAYLMISGVATVASGDAAAKLLAVDVTEVAWGKTLEEMLVARPVAVTKNPDGAKWLGVTITAAMAAITLF